MRVAWSAGAGSATEVEIEVAAGSTVLETIQAARVGDVDTRSVGIWGRSCSLDATVRAGDRVEIYRPLQIDPKEVRRLRAKKR